MTTYPEAMTLRSHAEQHRRSSSIGEAGRTEYGNK
jgi:hypothetical protein